METNGVFIGDISMRLLKKIEELTLYTIEQEQKITELKSLNTKLLELEKRLKELEKK